MNNIPTNQASGMLPWSLLILTWGLAFCMSCRIMNIITSGQPGKGTDSAAEMILGESRAALSAHFYEQADTYFHGGWEHQSQEAFRNGVFQKMQNEISPRFHIHLEGDAIKEIMPWMRLATMMNPADVRIYLDTAFWLAHESARPDIAEQVLQEAQINNPFNYQVQLERGRLFLMEKKVTEAKNAFDAGLAFWPGRVKMDEYELNDGKARLLLFRALIHETEGKKADAIMCLKEITRIFPERTTILARIRNLEEGKEPSLLASRLWSDMLRDDADRKSDDQCKHPGE